MRFEKLFDGGRKLRRVLAHNPTNGFPVDDDVGVSVTQEAGIFPEPVRTFPKGQ